MKSKKQARMSGGLIRNEEKQGEQEYKDDLTSQIFKNFEEFKRMGRWDNSQKDSAASPVKGGGGEIMSPELPPSG